jgi:predicted GNAT family acetyltransferase
MAKSNYERMIQMAEDVFDYRTDNSQLNVDKNVISHLKEIDPATMSEYGDGNGPVVWILIIPTTLDLMNQFLNKEITEKELYELTPMHVQYEAIYLCSAMVLEEYRGKGIAKRLTVEAIESIRKDHPIQSLFVWAFSKEGESLAEKVSELVRLPLRKKKT